jgi:hypothetical protein
LDAGLYHGTGPWQMVETTAHPWHINTPEDLARTEVHLAQTVHRLR